MNNYLVLLVITGFILCGKQFIYLWVGPDYNTSYYATVILMLCGYIPAVQTLGVNIQNAKNMHKMRSFVYFAVACTNVFSSIFLIRKFGVIGACLGTLFAILLGNGVFMNIYYQKRIGLNVLRFWKEISKSFPFCAITVLIGLGLLQIWTLDRWSNLLLFIGVYVVIYCLLLFAIGINKEERAFILQKLHKNRNANSSQ